jgi:phage gp36-like protein
MAYATVNDITEIYGEALVLALADRAPDGDITDPADVSALTAALDTATSEIDTYLGSRYTVPLNPVPPYIKAICIDIAVYRLAHDQAPRTVEMRTRYEDAIRFLNGISKGILSIDGATPNDGGDGTSEVGSSARIINLRRC